jgi:ligand-binding SRPBCC domain-containing protein
MRTLRFESRLAAPAAEVWAAASTMDGVNHELMPLMRMTHPPDVVGFDDAGVRTGEVVFRSWLLLGGVLPLDRHTLVFDRLHPGEGFDEHSRSWLQRVWMHQRRVQPDGDGCRVVDALAFEPRIPGTAALLTPIVRRLFEHRHRRLRARFGARA